MGFLKAYLDIVRRVFEEGKIKTNRTGVDCITIAGAMFSHEMGEGFPLLTTKKMPFRLIASELEFFIRGITDKQWLIDRNNHIWDEWCSPEKVPYAQDGETKKRMLQERDLGPIYGFQWRKFGAKYHGLGKETETQGIDQLKKLVETIKKDPDNRRMIVNAWNPIDLKSMALPPCHYCFQVTVIDNKLNLLWNQRSIDIALGLPFNIASYGLLLHLLAKETGYKEGKLVGFLADTHIYVTHKEGLKEQLKRKPYLLPKIRTENFSTIFDWTYEQTKTENYECYPTIKFGVAV